MFVKGKEWQILWPNRTGALPAIDQESLQEGQGGLWEAAHGSGTQESMMIQWLLGRIYCMCAREEEQKSERIEN